MTKQNRTEQNRTEQNKERQLLALIEQGYTAEDLKRELSSRI